MIEGAAPMRFLCDLTIKAKLTFLVVCTSLLMLAVGITGLIGLNSANKVAESIYKDRLVAIDQLNNIRNYQMQSRMNLLAARQETDAFEIMAYGDKVRSAVFQIEQILSNYRAKNPTGEEKRLFDAFIDARTKFGSTALLPAIDLLQAEKFSEADKLRKEKGDPLYAAVSTAIDNLIAYQTRNAEKDFAAAVKRATVVRSISISALLIGVVLSTALGIFLTRGINRGVASLQQAANRLAAGDLTTRVGSSRNDEIGSVAKSFDAMTDQFSGIVREVSQSSHKVGSTANRLSSISEQVVASSRVQSQEAAQAAASIEALNATFKDIAATAEQIEGTASEARAMAEQGNEVVATAVRGIQEVAQTVSESARMIADLGERSNQIGQILSVIKDIADQTNLLALNAAIEAARAGEQGRGFAVVADEVRKLAERTTHATSEISSMIGGIQSETGRAVAAMQKGSTQVAEGVTYANQAGDALKEINRSVAEAVNRIHEIASATRSHTARSEQITGQVEKIAALAESNSASLQETNQSVHALLEQATNLEQVVGRFRLAS
jgi:methyl-accepting chemotaxis protein